MSINEINYGGLIFSQRHELDKKAYQKYVDKTYPKSAVFNEWYGTSEHKKYIIPLLRKMKLEKIEKADI